MDESFPNTMDSKGASALRIESSTFEGNSANGQGRGRLCRMFPCFKISPKDKQS